MVEKKPRKKSLFTKLSPNLYKKLRVCTVENDISMAKYVEGKLVACRILRYAAFGYLDKLKESIESPDDILIKDYDNGTLAHYAALNGQFDVLIFIKANNGTLNEPDIDGNRPIDFAIANGHTECVAFLESENIKQWS